MLFISPLSEGAISFLIGVVFVLGVVFSFNLVSAATVVDEEGNVVSGSKITYKDVKSTAPRQGSIHDVSNNDPKYGTPVKPDEKFYSKYWKIILVVLVLIVIFIVIYFIIKKSKINSLKNPKLK